jgi:hypothetical protein
MSENTAFAVPKDRQVVTIRLSQSMVLEGEIFLELISEGLSIHQKVTAFLENNNAFFPVKMIPGGGTEFICKKNVQTVVVDFPADPETGYFARLPMHTIPVTAHFRDRNTLSGELIAEVPQEKARLSDCLNLPNIFLSVKTDGKMCYINKDALQKVSHKDKA